MKCPIDNTELVMTDRQGIEIDYCPKCRGVWLDRGELDKIIDRSAAAAPDISRNRDQSRADGYEQARYEEREYRRPSRDEYYEERHYENKKHKKEGFLGDLFDF